MANRMRPTLLFFLALLLPWPGIGSASTACPVTSKDREWSAACFSGGKSSRVVKPVHRQKLRLNRAGFAAITIDEPREVVIVDRHGKVVIPDVYFGGDFGFPHGRSGRMSFQAPVRQSDGTVKGKCGYIDAATYRLVISARYDHCRTFEDPVTITCTGCIQYCTEMECQNSTFINGQGYQINRFGKVLKEFPLPVLAQYCGAGESASVEHRGGSLAPYLRCIGPETEFAR